MPFHGELFGRIGREIRKGAGALGEFAGDVFGAAAPVLGAALGARIGGVVQGAAGRISGQRQVRAAAIPGIAQAAPLSPGIAGPPLDVGVPFAREEFVGIPQALPGGAGLTRAGIGLGGIGSGLARLLPGIAGGIAASGLFDIFGGNGGADLPDLPGIAPGGIFQVVGPTIRARHLVRVTNPMTGRDVWYRNVGRPILFAGDLGACNRVEKVARRARRSSRKR